MEICVNWMVDNLDIRVSWMVGIRANWMVVLRVNWLGVLRRSGS